jgi:hypothetical protein
VHYKQFTIYIVYSQTKEIKKIHIKKFEFIK